MPAPSRDFDREMAVLEAELRRLEAEYNMFFAGRAPRLPWEQRARVEALVRRYDRGDIQNTADRFRFQTLQSRFATFAELWERQMKAQEQGRPGPVRATRSARRRGDGDAGAEPQPGPQPEPAALQERPPAEFVPHVVKLHDPDTQAERVRELYEYLAEAKREAGQPPLPLDRVAALIRAQVTKFGDGHDLAFTVALTEGRVSLTVKPVDGD